jgi:hypothetical protein
MHPIKVFKILVITVFFVLFGGGSGWASTTRFFDIERIDLPKEGPVGRVDGTVTVRNNILDGDLFVSIQVADFTASTKPRGPVPVMPAPVKVATGATATLPFHFAVPADGPAKTILHLVVTNGQGVLLGIQPFDVITQSRAGRFTPNAIPSLSVPLTPTQRQALPQMRPRSLTTQTGPLALRLEIPAGAEKRLTAGTFTFPLRQLPALSTSRRQVDLRPPAIPQPHSIQDLLTERLRNKVRPEAFQSAPPAGVLVPKPVRTTKTLPLERLVPPAPLEKRSSVHGLLDKIAQGVVNLLPIETAHAQPGRSFTVTGRFSYIGNDNALHPAWNWQVRLLWTSPNGEEHPLAYQYIWWDGNWKLTFSDPGYNGKNLFVCYRMGEDYIAMKTEGGNTYEWCDFYSGNINATMDVGSHSLDFTPAGPNFLLTGLPEIYNSGYELWNRLLTFGLNPRGSSTINIVFPNTLNFCGGSTAWNCADSSGTVYIISGSSDAFTIQHELTHQMNYFYWGGKSAPNSSGPHRMDQCYTRGLGLMEGFADAVPVWVMSGEDASNPTSGGFAIENPDPKVICNGEKNETWVAGTFWDLLDRHADGLDNLYFYNPVGVFSLYLGAGAVNAITDIRPAYRNAASPGHQTLVDDVYRNNTIAVPSEDQQKAQAEYKACLDDCLKMPCTGADPGDSGALCTALRKACRAQCKKP